MFYSLCLIHISVCGIFLSKYSGLLGLNTNDLYACSPGDLIINHLALTAVSHLNWSKNYIFGPS